jgi:hypothetical protein
MAIERARPDLVSVAQNLAQALALANQSHSNVKTTYYVEAVGDMYVHADRLYSSMDTILDYEEAEMRRSKLPP